MTDHSPSVLHFSGHGGGEQGLFLQLDDGSPVGVSVDGLTEAMRAEGSTVKLIVLNACFSEVQARALIIQVPCVIGMPGVIGDRAAIEYAASFYRALASGRSVATAHRHGTAALKLHRSKTIFRDIVSSTGDCGPSMPVPILLTRAGTDAEHVYLVHASDTSEPPQTLTAHATQEAGCILTIRATLTEFDEHVFARVTAELRRLSKDMKVEIIKIEEGSVRLTLRLSPAGTKELLEQCANGDLTSICGFEIESVTESPATTGVGIEIAEAREKSTEARFTTAIGELTSIWRPRPIASVLRFEAIEDEPSEALVFIIEDPEVTYFIGRTERRSDGKRNDFALPDAWTSISRDQGALMIQDGDVVLVNTSIRDNVFVRGHLVAKGCARRLRHGDCVQVGHYIGDFKDGRYYSIAMPGAIDWRTGLLSRIGLIAEIGEALASGEPRLLFVIHCPPDVMGSPHGLAADLERKAVMVAAAIHRHDPSIPIARIGVDVAMLLATEDTVATIAAVAHRVSGTRSLSGFLKLHGTANQALPRLDACLGALSRIAIAGREPAGPEDLSRYALVPALPDAFVRHAHLLFDVGGGAVLFVLGDLERLKRMAPHVLSVLELELIEMVGARMGPRDIVSFAGPGLLLFGTPGDAELFAREVAVAWHARGPVTANVFEIDRYLSAHLLAISDLDDLVERAAVLVRSEMAALDASGLPAPLALGAIAVNETRDPVERARALVRLADLSWQLLAFILVASVRGAGAGDAVCDVARDAASEPRPWPSLWRSLARAAARRLVSESPRMMELAFVAAAADLDGPLREAMDVIAAAAESVTALDRERIEVSMPHLETAVREVFTALGPLRGWTLIAIVKSEVVDVDSTSQRIEYIDYTGPSARGSLQRVTVLGFRRLGPIAYLVRWNEGLAIAIEPFIRRTGDNELVLAVGLASEPGQHHYRSVSSIHDFEQTVTAKQLGDADGRS